MHLEDTSVSTLIRRQQGVLTLRMSHLVEREANTLLMQRFPNQVPSYGWDVVVFLAKDLDLNQMPFFAS